MISTSPLRYPGGKARFTKFIWNAIANSGEKPKVFVEPFCGGAGAAIKLLELGHVEQIAINDIDPLIGNFWKLIFGKGERAKDDISWIIGKIESSDLTILEWRKQKALKPVNIREAAWKCLFLNRTSFNGIIHRAGPIGGWEQKNRTLDVRFNREKLAKRLLSLFEMRNQVERTSSKDWMVFCSSYKKQKNAYLYLDPPYYHKAEQLYGHVFDEKTHLKLLKYLVSLSTPWMLSYDDAIEIRALYSQIAGIDGRVIDQTYSAHPVGGASFIGRELFFSNRKLPSIDLEINKKPHVGITILGNLEAYKAEKVGPKRTPFLIEK